MAKPPTSVRSIRLPDAVWAKLANRAAETGMSVNALVAAGADLAVTVLIHRSDVELEARFAAAAAERLSTAPLTPTPTPVGNALSHGKPGLLRFPKAALGSRLKVKK